MANTTPNHKEKVRVLIVDDDTPTRKLLKPAIEKWGHEVIEADSADSAWKILSEPTPPKLLVIDWIMPKVTGLDLCKRIRNELKEHFHPYIILLTSSSGSENIVTGLESGANEFLTKPINLAELKSRLNVGEQIIQYESQLTDQNTQLKNYIQTIEAANKLAQSASQKLGDAKKDSAKDKTAAGFHQLDKVDSDLNELLDIFSEFKPENKQNNSEDEK